jgi:hypothetical protein
VIEVTGAQVEIWNLSAPAPAQLRARRLCQNLIRGAVTRTLNGLTHVGLPCALNIQALARKR